MNSALFMTIWFIILLIALILHKQLGLDKYPIIRYSAIGLMVLVFIAGILVMFTGISFGTSKWSEEYGWHVDYMGYEEIHTYSTGESQRIALIDTGVSDFQEVTNLITFVGSDGVDYNGHGTMMYSIIKGYEDEVLGIAPNAEILSIKVMDFDESITPENLTKAIEKAINLESTVISLSLGSYLYSESVSKAIDLAFDQGITVVSSTGDFESPDMLFPASKSGVISVGSISDNMKVSSFTNAPNEAVINAPGDGIKSVLNNKEIEYNFGTSQATALISGYVALLRDYAIQEGVDLTNEDISSLLTVINNSKTDYINAFSKLTEERR